MEIDKNKIIDIEEFCKLFKLNIPIESEFEYYVNTLKESVEFNYPGRMLQDKIDLFIDLENYISTRGYSSVREYKNNCLDILKDFIVSTDTYRNLQESTMPNKKMATKNHINLVDESDILFSIDFQSANYSILKTFNQCDKNELEDSWEKLCIKFDVHPCLIKSKSFRQIVFGNTNPKRLQTFQHDKILMVLDIMQNLGFNDDKIVFLSHDEVVVKVKDASAISFLYENSFESIQEAVGMKIKGTIYSVKKIKKNTFVKTIYSVSTGFHTGAQPFFLEEYKTLHGVPGNKYYAYFKKHILDKYIEDLDLMYYNDGELCKWVYESDSKVKKTNFPHYEKKAISLSLQEAMNKHSLIWNELTKVLPDMSNEEKRRVVEVVANVG